MIKKSFRHKEFKSHGGVHMHTNTNVMSKLCVCECVQYACKIVVSFMIFHHPDIGWVCIFNAVAIITAGFWSFLVSVQELLNSRQIDRHRMITEFSMRSYQLKQRGKMFEIKTKETSKKRFLHVCICWCPLLLLLFKFFVWEVQFALEKTTVHTFFKAKHTKQRCRNSEFCNWIESSKSSTVQNTEGDGSLHAHIMVTIDFFWFFFVAVWHTMTHVECVLYSACERAHFWKLIVSKIIILFRSRSVSPTLFSRCASVCEWATKSKNK